MSAPWIQGAAVAAVVLLVLAVVFYSMCVAAHKADASVDEEAAELSRSQGRRQENCSTSTVNLAVCACAAALFGLAQLYLPGPSAAQADQDVQDEVTLLQAEYAAANTPARAVESAVVAGLQPLPLAAIR